MIFRPIIPIAAAAFLSGSVQAAEIERWACKNKFGTTIWTIADNRMFVAKGKGTLQVLTNNPSLTIAYRLWKSEKNHVVSYVYILDKQSLKLTVYDDMVAAVFKGDHGQPFEPQISVENCELASKENSN